MKTLVLALFALISPLAGAEVVWYDGSQAVSYCAEGKVAPAVEQAIRLFESDMEQVTGRKAVATRDGVIRIVQGKGSDDGFRISVKKGKILIEGHNARGAAYGLLELSRIAGVSPWVWWGDVRPERRERLSLPDTFLLEHTPSVQLRGIFINDEDWSLRRWSPDEMGPETYKRLFELMMRLRANTLWPAMHDVSPGFFTVRGNKEMADSFGILIGTSHCEPLLRNNVAEWSVRERGPYNYITNREQVQRYWAERLKEVKGSEELFTIGMRGIHDGSMEGVTTPEEKLQGLQQVIDDQRELIRKHYSRDVAQVPQVFIPYKEVLEIYESGLRVPDDVTLMWCDDNYGYLTRLPDAVQQQRSGGGGIYYHLSYWGRPHDYLWLTTTQPGLIFSEMRAAWDHNCRRLWIANVHDPKVAAYDLELFLDMAWDIDAVTPETVGAHLEQWLSSQFGAETGRAIAPAMRELCRLNAIRRPEFMGWTQVELDRKKYPGGKSVPSKTELTQEEALERMNDFARIEAIVDSCGKGVPERLQDAYFAHVLYPVHAAAAITRKMLSDSGLGYNEIQTLTERYNTMNGGKWKGLMSAAPRNLPVFAPEARTEFNEERRTKNEENGQCSCNFVPQTSFSVRQSSSELDSALTSSGCSMVNGQCVARNACDYDRCSGGCTVIDMLGHSMQAVALAKGSVLSYNFDSPEEGDAVVHIALIPTQPSDRGDLRCEVRLDDGAPSVISLKEPYRSEEWKRNVLRCQALKETPVRLTKGRHTLYIKALDDHIVVDQWMVDFEKDRAFYVIPVR